MNDKNPLSQYIEVKQEEINKDSALVKQKKKRNGFSFVTSLILFTGIIVGLIKTLLIVLK